MTTMQRIRHPWAPESAEEHEAAVHKALSSGLVMAYPTETAYALGGNALLPAVVESVYRLKGRPQAKALLLLIDGSQGVAPWAKNVSPGAEALMARFWPGPLTLVFEASPELPEHLRDDRGTVALRWSPHPCIDTLLRLGGVPLIGTSANLSGQSPAFSAEEVRRVFGDAVRLGIDGGIRNPGPVSTVLDTTVVPFVMVRRGAISPLAIGEALGEAHARLAP